VALAESAVRPEPCFRTLLQCIVTRVRETVDDLAKKEGQGLPTMRIGVHAWAMVMRNGAIQSRTIILKCIGRRCTTPTRGTRTKRRILLRDCSRSLIRDTEGGRCPASKVSSAPFTVLPRTARLAVFPEWLLHYVHTYRGQRPRVSISCNVIFEPAVPFATDRHVGATVVS